VGSSNLNIQSWLGNWELDVAVEDEAFAHDMEQMFLRDLENATEVVLNEHAVARPIAPAAAAGRRPPWRRTGIGRTRRAAAAGALRLGRTFGAALTARRALGAAEAVTLIWGIVLLAGLGVVGLVWPKGLAYPLGVLLIWLSLSWTLQAIKLWPLRHQRPTVTKEPSPAAREDAA
jgi:cardiolipin synthase